MSHWWFPGTNVVQTSTADTHLVTLRSGFLWQEAALPQLPISQIGIHHTKFLQSQKIIPTEMWPKNQFMNLLTPWLFVSQLINPLDSLSQRPERCFQQVKSSHSTHSSLCHIRTSLTVPFLHLHRQTHSQHFGLQFGRTTFWSMVWWSAELIRVCAFTKVS